MKGKVYEVRVRLPDNTHTRFFRMALTPEAAARSCHKKGTVVSVRKAEEVPRRMKV